jgi:glycerol uptake facilitator-like aquaporin
MVQFDLPRRAVTEFLGTWLLVATVVGSGIMAERLAGGNVAVALLGNTIATGAILVVLIAILAPISGAHFNPAVSLIFAIAGELPVASFVVYVAAQVAGGIGGTVTAHLMFDLPIVQVSPHMRAGGGQVLSEIVASFGLIATILGCRRFRPALMPGAVALFVVAGYWFTASTCFANPAVAIARSLTDTFSGIRPVDVPWFIGAEIAGAVMAALLFRWLLGEARQSGAVPEATPTRLAE